MGSATDRRLVVQARFPYAASSRGEPSAMVTCSTIADSLSEPEWIAQVTRMLVEAMEAIGSDFHRCQSMPSPDPADYVLAVGSWRVTRVNDMLAQTVYTQECHVDVELLYVGPFGKEQERQARKLGGPRSVATALKEWKRAQEIVKRDAE